MRVGGMSESIFHFRINSFKCQKINRTAFLEIYKAAIIVSYRFLLPNRPNFQ